MRWLSASGAACSCALLLTACGRAQQQQRPAPEPRLPRAVAQELASRADRVAERLDTHDACGAAAEAAQLQREVILAINAHRVPKRLQEPLQSAANSLMARVGPCV